MTTFDNRPLGAPMPVRDFKQTNELIRTEKIHLVCPVHGPYDGERTVAGGVVRHEFTECPKCAEERYNSPDAVAAREAEIREFEASEEKKARDTAQEAFDNAFRRSGIPADFYDKKLQDVRPIDPTVVEATRQARLYVQNFDRLKAKGYGFCFYGMVGTGKTMTACAILQELMPTVQGLYAPLWDVMQATRAANGYRPDTKRYDELAKAPLLVIDELGVQSGSGFEESLLMQIIDDRTANRRPTIFVTNLVPDSKKEGEAETLRSKLGLRIYNRICGRSVFMLFKGQSQRTRIKSIDEALAEFLTKEES